MRRRYEELTDLHLRAKTWRGDFNMTPFTSAVLASVKTHDIKTVSFDIFDTIVHRIASKPADVFVSAYKKVERECLISMSAFEYMELRVSTEQSVKRNAPSGEVTLEEIISALPFSQKIRTALLVAELESEAELSFLNKDMHGLVELLVKMGIKVVFISDMYLSTEQIRATFFDCCNRLKELPLYVSSECGSNKATGKLYGYVKHAEQLDESRWLHIGDNPLSDGAMAAKAGITPALLKGALNEADILRNEGILFSKSQNYNAVRCIATSHYHENKTVAFDVGCFVWGPIMLSFADWVIDMAIANQSKSILCLMREAEVFSPIIEWRLEQRNISAIRVNKLYASRKSTFWPAIETNKENWFEDLVYVLVQRRGYTVKDFYRDFRLPPDGLLERFHTVAIRDADRVFERGDNLLKLLTDNARNNKKKLVDYISAERSRFITYYHSHIQTPLCDCVVVDLGNGGTISHQIEAIMGSQSRANLLFYSSERIYRFSNKSCYSSFINAESDTRNIRQLLSRSPECIEPLLVGDCGTVTGYGKDEKATPEQAPGLPENSTFVADFLSGLKKFFCIYHKYKLPKIEVDEVLPVLYRYLQLPTRIEAKMFTALQHQDNFGSNDMYPIISEAQCDEIAQWPLESFYQEFCMYPKTKVGKIHWPQAVITLIDQKFLGMQYGLMAMDTDGDVRNLVERLLEKKWQRFSVYGAGLFFEKLLPYIKKYNLQIEHVIDRKAEISGEYEVAGFDVQSLKSALSMGCEKILISSFAFKDEIARNIYEQSLAQSKNAIEILSL